MELEIAVTTPVGAATARRHGADRVELCTALELGGLTPSQALLEQTVAVGLPVHVLVRCRPGDFVYDDDELSLLEREVATVVRAGAASVVIGALTAEGTVDSEALTRLVSAAKSCADDVGVTFHRAIDQADDPVRAVHQLLGAGVDRVLSSGGAASAAEGHAVLAAMVAACDTGLQVTAGGGVRPGDISVLWGSGVAAVHLSAKRGVPRRGAETVALGVADRGGIDHYLTDGDLVAAAREALDRCS